MTVTDLTLALPEIFVLSMACVVLLMDLYLPEERRGIVHLVSILTLIFAAILTLRVHAGGSELQAVTAFEGTFVRDRMGDLLKVFSYLVLGGVMIYAKHYLRAFNLFKGEFYSLTLFSLLGMMVMISSASLLSMYLGLELMSLSIYALVALNRNSGQASEAAMKYFVLGSMASGLLLYGMSMVYGATGTLALSDIATVIGATDAAGSEPSLILIFGLVFVVVGIAFKLGVVPFHMWVPDVYHGAPVAVTMFLGSVPKLAAFAMAYRVLEGGLGGLQESWETMLMVLAALSIVLGNVVAIAQHNIKRMLAYSTISHMGFVLLGFLSGEPQGFGAAMFYVIVYALMAAGAFAMVILLSRAGVEAEELDDFKGLNQRSPWYAAVMAMFMFSMAGVPVFVGFFAKWLVIKAALDAGLIWLAVLAVIFSVVGAFYYLRVVKLMYFDEPETTEPIEAPIDFRAVLSANGLAQLLLGLFPGALIGLCMTSFGA